MKPAMDQVEAYIEKKNNWKVELKSIISILRTFEELEETIKWGAPTYMVNGKNIIGVAAFKNYVGLWFHQGVFLKDESGVLINAQEDKTKGLRQWRFASSNDIDASKVKKYVAEAIKNANEGKEIKPSKKELVIPDELLRAFKETDGLKVSFYSLSRGKQIEYADYIGQAKRAETRASRLQKCIPMIEDGVGLNDRYK